jgi:hypothetical protein
MTKTDIKKETNRLQKLPSNKALSHKELEKKAIKNLHEREFAKDPRLVNDDEKKLAKKYFEKYLDGKDLENLAEVEALKDLVFQRLLKHRVETKINSYEKPNGGFLVNDKDLKLLHDIEDRIDSYEKKLGLLETEEEKKDELSALEKLKKRFNLWVNFNKNECTTICPHCQNPVLLRRRVKDFKALKHPFFAGRFYYNPVGIKFVKEGKWTREQYAEAFYTSPDFVDYCIEHEQEIIDIGEWDQADIEGWIRRNPYLKEIYKNQGYKVGE